METRIQWTEPKDVALERARLRNELRISAPVQVVGSAVFFAIIFTVVNRLASRTWHLLSSIVFGAIIGALIGAYKAWANRFPSVQQEVELRPEGFTMRGTKECFLRYDQLRGYSILYPRAGGGRHRLLSLYPRESPGAFSIGIPSTISDDAIRALIADQVPFKTIIDEQALTIA